MLRRSCVDVASVWRVAGSEGVDAVRLSPAPRCVVLGSPADHLSIRPACRPCGAWCGGSAALAGSRAGGGLGVPGADGGPSRGARLSRGAAAAGFGAGALPWATPSPPPSAGRGRPRSPRLRAPPDKGGGAFARANGGGGKTRSAKPPRGVSSRFCPQTMGRNIVARQIRRGLPVAAMRVGRPSEGRHKRRLRLRAGRPVH